MTAAASSRTREASPLAPFTVRSFRFQFPSDLLAAWAMEMEALILGWFILVETGSVFYLTLYGALQFLGTLLSPMAGVAGDRLGRRTMLCALRAALGTLAAIIMALAALDLLDPIFVLAIAFVNGLVRPSDLVMRNSLIGDTMPAPLLMGALGLSRTTMDTAKIAGALAGAALFAVLGITTAYAFIVAFYAASFALALGVARGRPIHDSPPPGSARRSMFAARWAEMVEGLAYAWRTPGVLALMALAFLVNFTAFPWCYSLLPYVAREIYGIDATGLSHMTAGFATGALVGSIFMTFGRSRRRDARFMVINIVLWHVLLGIFAWIETKWTGIAVLFVMGLVHSLAMVAMSGLLLRDVDERFRARVMGIRMLAVYGLPIGLLLTGPLIGHVGFAATATGYVIIGALLTGLIAWRWRETMWR